MDASTETRAHMLCHCGVALPRPCLDASYTKQHAHVIVAVMALARTLIIVALTVSFFTFVAFFGRLPAFRCAHCMLIAVPD